MIRQRTIREKVSCLGVGLHSGREVRVELLPAPACSGVTFVRTDLSSSTDIKASVGSVANTTLATTLAAGVNGSRAEVSTVEHLLSALTGLGVDNIRVLVHGPELPILDGSAAPWVELLISAGLEEQKQSKRFLVIKREVKVQDGAKLAKLSPGHGLRITCSLDYDHPVIASAELRYEFSEASFRRELMRARTFGFLRDVEALRARGLALGGSLDNAVVIDGYRVMNPDGLRYPDEFVRHKVLDALGDLSLFGMPVIGKLALKRPGHALNTLLVKAVLSDPRNFAVVEATRQQDHVEALGENVFSLFEPIGQAASLA